MASCPAVHWDLQLHNYFRAQVRRLHQPGHLNQQQIKRLWTDLQRHREHQGKLRLRSQRYEVVAECSLPCHCLALAELFECFLAWKQLSPDQQNHLLERLHDLTLMRDGQLLEAKWICSRRILKRNYAVFTRQPCLETGVYLSDILETERTELDTVLVQSGAGSLSPALSAVKHALQLRSSDCTRRTGLPLETESQWAIKAGLLANAQQLEPCEVTLEAEIWYRKQLTLHAGVMRIQLGLAAGYKQLGDLYCKAQPDKATKAYKRGAEAGRYVAEDYLTLAQMKEHLLGRDVATEGLEEETSAALAEYYAALGARSLGRQYLTKRCPGAVALALGATDLAKEQWLHLKTHSQVLLAQAHQGLGELYEQESNYERAWLEHAVSLSYWVNAHKAAASSDVQTAVEAQLIRLAALRNALNSNQSLPEHFSATLKHIYRKQSIPQPGHVVVRNIHLWDDMGGELPAPVADCYCHDCDVLVAEAFAALGKLDIAKEYYTKAAEKYRSHGSLNGFFAWKRLGDFYSAVLQEVELSESCYSTALQLLGSCSATGCWWIEQTYPTANLTVWMLLGGFYFQRHLFLPALICSEKTTAVRLHLEAFDAIRVEVLYAVYTQLSNLKLRSSLLAPLSLKLRMNKRYIEGESVTLRLLLRQQDQMSLGLLRSLYR